MGKRSRNKSVTEADRTIEEQIAVAEKEYAGLKRTMTVGAVAIALLIVGLIIRQPGGWVIAVVVLGLIEGISYVFLRISLERRRDERIARIKSGESS
jgi:hypothetical protein